MESKEYVELSDIKAFRLTCSCGMNLSLPIETAAERVLSLMSCPGCREQLLANKKWISAVSQLGQYIELLKDQQSPLSLSFEIPTKKT